MKPKKTATTRESTSARKGRSLRIVKALRREYPDAGTALQFSNPLQLLISVILSAQCTDVRVNMVTPMLFKKYRTANDFAGADRGTLETEIHSTGFFRNKAKSIIGCCRALVENHGGNVPSSMEELVALPGVGRKTANCVLGSAFGIASGVVVDTHVARLASLLGLTKNTDPVRIENDLCGLFPREEWIYLGNALILHGRRVCVARRPKCRECVLSRYCPSSTAS